MSIKIMTRNIDVPVVSIIVPIYNRDGLVHQLIDTVCKQTFKNWELILVDDRSTDKTVEVIQRRAASESRIRLTSNCNQKGPSGARNHGLIEATGKYIAYQDSDDEWHPNHLEKMVYFLEKYPERIDLMTANPLRKYYETNEVFKYDTLEMGDIEHEKLEDAYIISGKELFDVQLRERAITTQCIVAKAEVLKKVRWNEDLHGPEDKLHNLQLSSMNIRVAHIQEFHTVYWAHSGNLTNCGSSQSPDKMEPILMSFIRYWHIVMDRYDLSKSQKTFVRKQLSGTYAWHLGYNTYEPQKKYVQANASYLNALKLEPFNIEFWKSYLKSFVKAKLTKRP